MWSEQESTLSVAMVISLNIAHVVVRYCPRSYALFTQTRDVDQVLVGRRASVVDGGPTLYQYWGNVAEIVHLKSCHALIA